MRRQLADKFLHTAIVPANAYQRTKFQLSSSISFGHMRGSQNKKWELLMSPDAPQRTNFHTGSQYAQMPTSVPNFNFLALLVSEIKRTSQNLMWGLLAPCRAPYAESTWQGKTACQISASYLYASCSYANMYFPQAFYYMCPKMVFLGGFEGEGVKILSSVRCQI